MRVTVGVGLSEKAGEEGTGVLSGDVDKLLV